MEDEKGQLEGYVCHQREIYLPESQRTGCVGMLLVEEPAVWGC